jgi:hypothetical protein
MKQHQAVYTLGTWSVGVTLGLMAACAGGDTPARTPELVEQIAVMYAGAEPVGAAAAGGGSGIGGSGGSAATGSGGSTMAGTAGAGAGSSSGACDGFAILETKCSGGSCHSQQNSGPGALSNFVLDETTAAAFEGEQSSNCAEQDNAPIFDAGNPAASLVVKKITNTASCGGRMPLGASTQGLTDAELTCVKNWIATL